MLPVNYQDANCAACPAPTDAIKHMCGWTTGRSHRAVVQSLLAGINLLFWRPEKMKRKNKIPFCLQPCFLQSPTFHMSNIYTSVWIIFRLCCAFRHKMIETPLGWVLLLYFLGTVLIFLHPCSLSMQPLSKFFKEHLYRWKKLTFLNIKQKGRLLSGFRY